MCDVWCLDLNTVNSYCWYKDFFDSEEMNILETYAEKLYMEDAKVGGDGNDTGDVSPDVRQTRIGWVQANKENAWIYQRLTGIVNEANKEWFDYDLRHIEALQFTEYKPGMFYDKHIDTMYQSIGLYPRKLSFTLQLTDPSEYEGGDVLLHTSNDPFCIKKDRGAITFFPSYTLHEVMPVTKGTRRCLVGWVHGPKWK